MTTADDQWLALVDELERWVVPSWITNAREHGNQPWIRLVLMVDAHAMLCKQQPTEKIAVTMADLAQDPERAGERAGWEALASHTEDARMAIVAKIVDLSPELLPGELMPYFERSVEPVARLLP